MNGRLLLSSLAGFFLLSSLSAQTTPAVTVPPPVVTIGTGFDYSSGDYGLADDTEVMSVPLVLGYTSGNWNFEARAPWVRIKGPATVVGAGGGAVRPTAAAESGLGDIYLSSTYRFGAIAGDVNSSFTLRVKLPTADEDKGLGTGEADYYGQLDFFETFGSVTPYVSLGYAVLGDSNVYQLEDGPFASAGAHFRTSDSTVFTLGYNWRHRFVAGGDSGSDALAAVTHDINASWRVMLYGLVGFSDASPDAGGGLQLSYRF